MHLHKTREKKYTSIWPVVQSAIARNLTSSKLCVQNVC